ncbi:DUF3298 and DUF4163 domain-containing protein [Turicimonas muris]|uniref:DUF3298 and DUF4163 domain-containing protein n=1 Tax=Turicimonas muris TaxID=1796652 RepID=UPI002495A211|nr:DUF3298 and DUF4163 domain-containing protein [Turicimonas muris]
MHYSKLSTVCFIAVCSLVLSCSTTVVSAQQLPEYQNSTLQIEKAKQPSVSMSYPVFGKKNIDKAIKFFVDNQAAAYLQIANENFEAMDEESRKLAQWDMNGSFKVTQPSKDIVSIVFTIESYSGGAHGNYSEEVLNFDLKTDRELQFQDLFEKPSVALKLLSQYCAPALKEEIGEQADTDMIAYGTYPTLANFSEIQLIPGKVIIHFQPYQVAPWVEGAPQVIVPLEKLLEAKPETQIFSSN